MNREADLSPAVTRWLKSLGYSVYAEIKLWSSPVDHVGVRWSDEQIICVELKCSCTRKLLYQSLTRKLITPLVYVALPRPPRQKSVEILKQYGMGLLVDGVPLFEPEGGLVEVFPSYRDAMLRRCRESEEGGVGGVPTMKGDGPAIRVMDAVSRFRRDNPAATWREIFETVPNHYASANSMRSALRRLRE